MEWAATILLVGIITVERIVNKKKLIKTTTSPTLHKLAGLKSFVFKNSDFV